MKKVYCKNCVYCLPISENCKHPSNVIYGYTKDNWFSPAKKYLVGYKRKPKEINKNNDCKNYKPTLSSKLLHKVNK